MQSVVVRRLWADIRHAGTEKTNGVVAGVKLDIGLAVIFFAAIVPEAAGSLIIFRNARDIVIALTLFAKEVARLKETRRNVSENARTKKQTVTASAYDIS